MKVTPCLVASEASLSPFPKRQHALFSHPGKGDDGISGMKTLKQQPEKCVRNSRISKDTMEVG